MPDPLEQDLDQNFFRPRLDYAAIKDEGMGEEGYDTRNYAPVSPQEIDRPRDYAAIKDITPSTRQGPPYDYWQRKNETARLAAIEQRLNARLNNLLIPVARDYPKQDDSSRAALRQLLSLNQKIERELPNHIAYNPAATNFTFTSLMDAPAWAFQKRGMSNLTNAPNTLVVDGHGNLSLTPGMGSGFFPDSGSANHLSSLVNTRAQTLNKNYNPLVAASETTGGGISLGEIARGMGSQTNEVKRAVILSCFAAGYTLADVQKHFPNAVELIASDPGRITTAGEARRLGARETAPSPRGTHEAEYRQYVSPLYRITPTSTNEIRKASDWVGDNPPPWFKYLPPPQ